MAEVAEREEQRKRVHRGRIDKRKAILDAAFAVFARKGYAQACVNEIAVEAGVAKPTVYNHLTDKVNLFRHAVEAASDALISQNLATIGRLADPGDDIRGTLLAVGSELARLACNEQAQALRRLLYAEAARFPELLDAVPGYGPDRLTEALADRFARLALAGRLRISDPALAAEQFLALITGPLETRSHYGNRSATVQEQQAVTAAAVDTFLLAFG
ncbi:TetR/AcrR family transcriptional regulator [Micromonospora humidisoli]|uniref:TetR/AcrR family transcriptional regulator n=1 Tax=Micromonospora humidisoli TaxID=2807622 RepID=A0ABS2JJC5_9ACTN|nr:TetR/AcrR family transcriptional regulator [Micromonospora humidisoli]MBM7086484.1 TetR/AcrR family transcriptional regulator [Micromonospora humidisoli]